MTLISQNLIGLRRARNMERKEEYFQEVLEMIADMGGCSGAMASEALNAWNK